MRAFRRILYSGAQSADVDQHNMFPNPAQTSLRLREHLQLRNADPERCSIACTNESERRYVSLGGSYIQAHMLLLAASICCFTQPRCTDMLGRWREGDTLAILEQRRLELVF